MCPSKLSGPQRHVVGTKRYLHPVHVAPGVIHGSAVDGDDAHGPRDILGRGLGHRRTILSIGFCALRGARPGSPFPRSRRPPAVLLLAVPPPGARRDNVPSAFSSFLPEPRLFVVLLRLHPYLHPSTFPLSPSFPPVPSLFRSGVPFNDRMTFPSPFVPASPVFALRLDDRVRIPRYTYVRFSFTLGLRDFAPFPLLDRERAAT